MKKLILLLILAIGVAQSASAQTYDTITSLNGRVPGYYYHQWYDTCKWFCDEWRPDTPAYRQNWDEAYYRRGEWSWDFMKFFRQFTKRPIAIVGLGVFQCDGRVVPDFHYSYSGRVLDSSRIAEYAYLVKYYPDSDTNVFLDSVRWDTAEGKVLRLPYHCDTDKYGFANYWFHEALFEAPIVVDSFFALGGSHYNNEPRGFDYQHLPTCYGFMDDALQYNPTLDCDYEIMWTSAYRPYIDMWFPSPVYGIRTFGYVIPKVDYANVSVTPADSTRGTAGPNETLSMHLNQTIYADPYPGYRFSHWNDGDTNNPRSVFLMQDTAFVAYFVSDEPCEVVVISSDETKGTVSGGGTYWCGDTIAISAEAFEPYRFIEWSDGDTNNPRLVVPMCDTVFTAVFGEPLGIDKTGTTSFTLSPNPAQDVVVVGCRQYAAAKVSFYDMSGHEVIHAAMSSESTRVDISSLPAGVYYVTLTTPQGTSSQRLVVR